MRGTVKWFNKDKGYGFITSDEGTDYFVHFSGINGKGFKSLESDDIVEFDLKETERGMKAVNVTPIITINMVERELAKESLRLLGEEGSHSWYVVDESDNPVVDKEMNLIEVAAYAGICVEETIDKSDNPVVEEFVEKFTEAFHTKVLADVVTDAIEKEIQIDA